MNSLPPQGLLIDGRYLTERELGRGTMGVVYLAKDASLDRYVAIKVIGKAWLHEGGAVDRFRREAAALAAVRSPHVVQVYAFGPFVDTHFFAMEYVRGSTLEDAIAAYAERGATVPLHRAVTMVGEIAAGIDHVHERGLVHRDIKPSNVIVEEDTGRSVLIDFGLAAATTGPGAVRGGTPAYMAPEMAHATDLAAIGPAADIYSLGCTVFELLTGRLPFDPGSLEETLKMHATAPPPPASSLRSELAPFDAPLARAMAKSPEHRYSRASDFASELDAARRIVTASKTGAYPVAGPAAPPPSAESYAMRATDPVEPQRPEKIRVLVVDDDESFRKLAGRAVQLGLFRLPISVSLARSGTDAVAHARTHGPPHLLLLDFNMPGLTGLETLSRLRALPGGADMHVLVISAVAGSLKPSLFAVLGCRDLLSKPMQLEQLVERIAEVAQRRGWNALFPASD